MYKILYVPLDERTCNYKYPSMLAKLTDDIELLVPPKDIMGNFRIPGDVDKLWEWIFDNIDDADYGIFSVDTLIYGNIVNSRLHNKTKDECDKYIRNLQKIKELNSKIQIHGINLVARVANYNHNSEEPLYWSEYGANIWEYSYLVDKISRGHSSSHEDDKLKQLKNKIPKEYLNDFLERRSINTYVNLKVLGLVEEGLIDHLVIPKDDTAEYGYAALAQKEIAKEVFKKELVTKVMVYPGADEVGCVLFTRIFNLIKNYKPVVYIRYSSVNGKYIIPKYEDRPLHEGVKSQITSLGGVITESEREADFLFAIHSPGKTMMESSEQHKKDVSYYSYANILEFLNYIRYYSDKYNKPYAIADTAFCNGSDNELMVHIQQTGILKDLITYCGWNTSQNTIGLALAHINICAYYDNFKDYNEKKILSEQYLMTHLIESWLFEANAMMDVLGELKDKNINPYKLAAHEEEVRALIASKLQKEIDHKLYALCEDNSIMIKDLLLPWSRVFDIDFDVVLTRP